MEGDNFDSLKIIIRNFERMEMSEFNDSDSGVDRGGIIRDLENSLKNIVGTATLQVNDPKLNLGFIKNYLKGRGCQILGERPAPENPDIHLIDLYISYRGNKNA